MLPGTHKVWNKVPHGAKCHTIHMLGVPLGPWGFLWSTTSHPQYTIHSDPTHDAFNNLAMIIYGPCVIWSLARSDNGTRMCKGPDI